MSTQREVRERSRRRLGDDAGKRPLPERKVGIGIPKFCKGQSDCGAGRRRRRRARRPHVASPYTGWFRRVPAWWRSRLSS